MSLNLIVSYKHYTLSLLVKHCLLWNPEPVSYIQYVCDADRAVISWLLYPLTHSALHAFSPHSCLLYFQNITIYFKSYRWFACMTSPKCQLLSSTTQLHVILLCFNLCLQNKLLHKILLWLSHGHVALVDHQGPPTWQHHTIYCKQWIFSQLKIILSG